MAVDEPGGQTRTSLRNAISNAMARIKREFYGKGPSRTRTFIFDRIVFSNAEASRSWIVPAKADGPNILELEASAVFNPSREGVSDDSRDLGLQLLNYSWKPE